MVANSNEGEGTVNKGEQWQQCKVKRVVEGLIRECNT